MNRALLHITTIIICCILTASTVSAQHCKFYEITYKDSLTAEKGTSLLVNNVKIVNVGQKTIRLALAIDIPKNWKNVSNNKHIDGDELFYNLAPRQSKVIPLNIIKLPKASVNWDSVKITVRLTELADTHAHYYHVSAALNPRFTGEAVTDEIRLMQRPEVDIPLSISLKNTGNVSDDYTIKYESYRSDLHHKTTIHLEPGHDTVYTYEYGIPALQWSDFQGESIAVSVTGKVSEDLFSHTFSITRSRRTIRKQKYPYKYIPITLEAGLLNFGNITTYYGAASGTIDFEKDHNLYFNYRSRQIGTELIGVQRDMFTVTYNYHKWSASAGQIASPQQFFMSNGRGANLTYKPTNKQEYIIAANLKDANFFYNSNTFAASARYGIGKISMRNVVAADFNDRTHTNSYGFSNDIGLISNENMSLVVTAGGGIESRDSVYGGVQKVNGGLLGGYVFTYRLKNWRLNSTTSFFGMDVPGTQKGMSLQIHQLTRSFKKGMFLGVDYTLNHIKTRYFVDTLYNTDVLRNNSERYGVTTGINTSKQRVSASFGYLKSSAVTGNTQSNPYYLDLNYSLLMNSRSYVSLGVQNAFSKTQDVNPQTVYATSISGMANYNFFGVAGSYTRSPLYADAKAKEPTYQHTIMGGPFVNFNFFNRKLSGSLRYNIAKSLYDTVPRQLAYASLVYQPSRFGLTISASVNMPLNSATINGVRLPISETKSFSISVVKHLNIPVITKRRYVSMKSVTYHDANSNGIKDANERPLSNVRLEVTELDTAARDSDSDDDMFSRRADELYTNKKGEARYLNTNKGVYMIGIGAAETEGMVPSKGNEQKVVLDKNKVLEIPFKQAKVINGNIRIDLDSFGTTKLTPDYIKVICKDSTGRKLVTLTDRNGNFFFNVSAGRYTVSLNPNAFTNSDFKPEQIEYQVELTEADTQKVQFVIKQKKRKVRYLDTSKDKDKDK